MEHWLIGLFLPFLKGTALGLIAMSLHECGHMGAAAALGVRVKRVGIDWKKGFFTVREKGTDQQNLVIALAGPFVNLCLLVLEPWCPLFSLANFSCALANMLPIDGSDGFRVAECWRRMRQGKLPN